MTNSSPVSDPRPHVWAGRTSGPRAVPWAGDQIVIDAPTLIHLVSEHLKVHAAHRLVAPNAIRSQALALLLEAVRSGQLAEKEALALEEWMTEVKMRLLGDRVSRRTAWRIAREQDWDDLVEAEYVAVTRLQADALVSVDRDFARRLQTLVPIEPVEALSLPPDAVTSA